MHGQEFNYMPSFESVPYLAPSGACWFLSSLKLIPITLFGWFHSLPGPDALLLLPRQCFILKFMFHDRRVLMIQMILLNEQEQLGNKEDLPTEKRIVRWLAKLEDCLSLDVCFLREPTLWRWSSLGKKESRVLGCLPSIPGVLESSFHSC